MSEQQELHYNLRNYKVVQALDVEEDADDQEEEGGLCSDDSGEEFVVSNNDVSDCSINTDKQSDKEYQKKYQDDDDDVEREAEDVSKRRRLIDSAECHCPEERVPSTLSQWTWSEQQPDRRGRRASGIFLGNPSPKNDAMNVRSPLQAFNVLFSEDLIEKIVNHTNQQIIREIARLNQERRMIQSYHSQTDKIEINALIGLLYYTAVLKQNNVNTRDMWSEEFGCGIFRAVMSEKRFCFLILMLRFDDKNTRRSRQFSDKLAPCREIWEIFIKNCVSNYEPSDDCTIDEQFVNFRGKCSFRVYVKNNTDKYGLKIYRLKDAKTSYMISAIPYVGKVTSEDDDSVPTYFVRKLVESASLEGSWRTITMDNWFTSVPLFMLLKEKYQLRAVGEIRKNKCEIPSSLKIASPVNSSRFLFTDDLTLVSYAPKKNNIVFFLSSLHRNSTIDSKSNEPEIIIHYNKRKDATNLFDQKCCAFSVTRRTRRWPLKFFYNMLNQVSVNSSILYNLWSENPSLGRAKFLKDLAFALIQPLLQRRLEQQTLRLSIRQFIATKLLRVDKPVARGYTIIREESRAKCGLCKTESSRRTRMKCTNCLRRICDEHRCGLCIECVLNMNF